MMNLIGQSGDADPKILFVGFNQDTTSLAVGFKSGYKLFSLNYTEKLDLLYESTETDDVSGVERLFSSSLIALVSLQAPRKLKVCHFKKGTEICNYSYSNTILAVRLNRQRLIVCLEESLYIHNIRDMKVLHTIKDTPPNLLGVCALSMGNDNSYLAYPGSSQLGQVQIFDSLDLKAVNMIPAHNSPLASLSFDSTGSKLATASNKGTVIRVFSVSNGDKIFEFRRGVKRCVSISSLRFSEDSLFLAASSNTETIHIFKLEINRDPLPDQSSSWMDYLGKAVAGAASYLPTNATDAFTQVRGFATAKLPHCGVQNCCSLSVVQKILRVLVASHDGYLYIYNLDPKEGGDCQLLRRHKLDGLMEAKSTQESFRFPDKLNLDDDNDFPPMTHHTE